MELSKSRFPVRGADTCRSRGQYNLGRQILQVYPGYVVLEEFSIPDSRLSLDFFVPNAKIAFEFQGIQHDEFNKHFHVDAKGLARQVQRDREKRRWCEMNDITLIEVRDEHITKDKLRALILGSEEDE